jgi:hypothetical protein
MLRRVVLVRNVVSEERTASIIWVRKIDFDVIHANFKLCNLSVTHPVASHFAN